MRKSITSLLGLFSLIFIICFQFALNFPLSGTNNTKNEHNIGNGLNVAGYWTLSNIYINGSATGVDAHNWSWVVSQPWFGGGNGTQNNPFCIENITIKNTTTCIEIYNSDEFFTVCNCTLYNSSIGIYLNNVSNGLINNNNVFNNDYGVYLYECVNNSINHNSITGNSFHGIYLRKCNSIYINYNTIIGLGPSSGWYEHVGIYFLNYPEDYTTNNAKVVSNNVSNIETAIRIQFGVSCNFSSNNIYNVYVGISMSSIDESFITRNKISQIGENGIILRGSSNKITYNEVFDVVERGIILSSSENNIIKNNMVKFSMISGISLSIQCEENNVEKNTLNNNYDGITIEGSNDNTITENLINNSGRYGIFIGKYEYKWYDYQSSSNGISHNIIENSNNTGIYLYNGEGTFIIENHISKGTYGIHLKFLARWNVIDCNTITNNLKYGIFLEDQCSYNDIIDNNINDNYCGINITQNSDNNDIIRNNLLDNSICYSIDENCDNTNLQDNICSESEGFNPLWIIIPLIIPVAALMVVIFWYDKKKRL